MRSSCGDEARKRVDTEYEKVRGRKLVEEEGQAGLGTQNARPVRLVRSIAMSQACPAFLLPPANRCRLRLSGHSAYASAVETTPPRCYFRSPLRRTNLDICKPHASSANSRSRRRNPPPLTFEPYPPRSTPEALQNHYGPHNSPNATQKALGAVGPALPSLPEASTATLRGLSPSFSSIRMASSQTS